MRGSAWAIGALLAAGCVGEAVGDPCASEQVPEGGFDSRETYVETSAADCVSRVCVVRGLSGEPRDASAAELERHVYCSCRCDDVGQAPGCDCPLGFGCQAAGQLGSYCVRE